MRLRSDLVAHPGADEAAVPGDHLLLLVRREDRADDVDEQRVEFGAGDVLDYELAHRGHRGGAEVLVRLDLEVLVREPAVFAELLPIREVAAVADIEVAALVLVDHHPPPADDAEETPLDERLHRPREVVVQTRERDVGGSIRVIDRMYPRAADEVLARVELP